MQIPIRNVWLLQLFASDLYQSAGAQLADAEANPEQLPQLVATMLADEVAQRLHTGLTVGFTRTTRAVTRVRGRINALPTVRGQLLERGRVSCTFDEVVTDIPPNRLVRAALERAARLVPDVPRYRSLALQLEVAGVGAHCPPLSMVPSMRRQRLYARDRHMLAAAELLLTLMIPTTTEGDRMLPAAEMSDQYLRRLFEHAAYGFYKHRLEPGGWSVRHGEKLTWQTSHESGGMAELLPGMQLDITLQSRAADLRAAIYKAAAMIPGVTFISDQATLDGRTGVAIGRVEDAWGTRVDIIIDPDTGTFIGDREVLLRDQDGVPAGTAVRWTSVTSSVVDEAPEGGSVCGKMTVNPETGQC